MRTSLVALVAIALAVATGACQVTEAKELPAPKNVRYDTVQELRRAVVDAGLSCPRNKPLTDPAEAAEGVECRDDLVLLVFSTDSATDRNVENLRSIGDLIDVSFLVGPNWIVNADTDADLRRAQRHLGGVLERSDRNTSNMKRVGHDRQSNGDLPE